jgi:hypothetical protein
MDVVCTRTSHCILCCTCEHHTGTMEIYNKQNGKHMSSLKIFLFFFLVFQISKICPFSRCRILSGSLQTKISHLAWKIDRNAATLSMFTVLLVTDFMKEVYGAGRGDRRRERVHGKGGQCPPRIF